MVNIITMPLGDYQTNCYLVRQDDASQCVVIDPGYSPEKILDRLAREHLTPQAILLTHGHFDHVGAVRELAAETDCPVYLCKEDLALPPAFTAGPLYTTHSYGEGDRLTLAGLSFQVLHTPGHTPGSVCLICEDCLFAGDTLFAGSCGRTDLPLGSGAQMRESLKRLKSLPKNYRVFPGHGPSSTLDEEKNTNPYLI